MFDFFQIISAKITAFVTVVIITVANILPGAASHTNKPADTSTATSSAAISESPSPIFNKSIKKQAPEKSTPSPSTQANLSNKEDNRTKGLQNELQKINELKGQDVPTSIQTQNPTQPLPTPSPTLVPNIDTSQNGITSLSFKTYWHYTGQTLKTPDYIAFDYFLTVCFPSNQVVKAQIYIINSDGKEDSVSNTAFYNAPCEKQGGVGLSLKSHGFNQLGEYILKVVIDNPPQTKTATSTIGVPQ